MIEVKDLMWAVWCVIAAFGAYRVGHFLGFKLGIEVAKATIGKAIIEGRIDVPKQDQRADLNNATQRN
jgi:hypothetical protein